MQRMESSRRLCEERKTISLGAGNDVSHYDDDPEDSLKTMKDRSKNCAEGF